MFQNLLISFLIFLQFCFVISKSGKKKNDNVIGIHFGEKYIRVSFLENGDYNSIPNIFGDLKTEICVSFDENGHVFVGRAAKFNKNPQVILDNLHFIAGKRFDEITSMKEYPFNYEIKHKYNKPYIKLKSNNRTYELSVEDCLAHVFTFIKRNAERYLHVNVTSATMTVPDHFLDSQILSIKAAANVGGLQILRSVKDSIASIYAYQFYENEEERTILIIDIEDSFMNMMVVSCDNNGQEILAARHNNKVNKNHFIDKLESYIFSIYHKITESKLTLKSSIKELRKQSKFLFEELTLFNSVAFQWNSIGVDIEETIEITRAKFDELILDSISKILEETTGILLELDLKRSHISEVILLGSVFNVPKIQKEIRNYFYGHELRFEMGFEETPVLGISIIGCIFMGISEFRNIVLFDILSSDLGIEVYGGMADIVISRMSVIPIKKSKYYTITFQNQRRIHINFLEGRRPVAKRNFYLGHLTFEQVSDGLRHLMLFKVEFHVRSNDEIFITATEMKNNVTKSLLIKKDFENMDDQHSSSSIPSPYSEKDDHAKRIHDLRNDIETIAYELNAHLIMESSDIKMIQSIMDTIILRNSVDEVIHWLDNNSPNIQDLEELKRRFESNIKPILARYYDS